MKLIDKDVTDMDEVIHDIRKGWTEEEWNDYYQTLAEANEEEEEENLTQD